MKQQKGASQKYPKQLVRFDVHRIAPTVQGVTEAARLLRDGQVLILPTETVYTVCTTLSLDVSSNATTLAWEHLSRLAPGRPMLHVTSAHDLCGAWFAPPKPYALKSQSLNVERLSESREVFLKLAGRFWPGPLPIYVRQNMKHNNNKLLNCLPHLLVQRGYKDENNEQESSNAQHQRASTSHFVGIQCPSHPLFGRVQKEVHKKKTEGAKTVAVGIATQFRKARDACQHYLSFDDDGNTNNNCDGDWKSDSKKRLYVLNGEDQRELFAVPTCQCPRSSESLWIDDSCCTIYLEGIKNESAMTMLSVESVYRALLGPTSASSSPTSSPTSQPLSTRQRVIAGVLSRWKVVDRRV